MAAKYTWVILNHRIKYVVGDDTEFFVVVDKRFHSWGRWTVLGGGWNIMLISYPSIPVHRKSSNEYLNELSLMFH